MLVPLSLLTCWITPLKSLSPDSAWTLPVCLETSICQSLSCTHTHTHAQSCSIPPLRLSYLFRLKKCVRSNGTVRCRIQQCHASLHWLLMHCMGCFNVLKLKCEALKNLVWEYTHIYVSDFWFWPAEMERMKERSMLLNFSCKHSISWSVGWCYQTILAHHRYFHISRYLFSFLVFKEHSAGNDAWSDL